VDSNQKSGNINGLIAILGLVALIAGLVLMLSLPEIRIAGLSLMGVGVVLLAIVVVLDFRRVRRAVTGRRGRLNLATGVMSIVFIGIIVVANGISVGNYRRVDTSSLEQFTLTPQTVKVLKDIQTPVKVTAYFVPEDKDTLGIVDYLTSLLSEYKSNTTELAIQYVDPDQHPDQANKYGITEYQTVVFESGDRRRLVPPSQYVTVDDAGVVSGIQSEHAFTSAILEVTGVAQKKVYFLTGNGEGSINSNFSKVKEALLDDLYLVGELNLITDPNIPGDCAALIIVAPQYSLTAEVMLTIQLFLLNGGQVMILTNPDSKSDFKTIINPWGVEIGEGTIVDPSSSVAPHADMPVVPYNRNYFYLPSVYFPGATAIIPKDNVSSGIIINPLVWTDSSAWLDKNFTADTTPVFDSNTEKMEPLRIGVLIAYPVDTSGTKYMRMVIIGDSDFASNENFDNANNGDLFLSSVRWLSEETSLISIHRNVQPFRRLVVTASQENFITYSSMGLLPVILLVVAGVLWWRRR
jgi:ABC-2 type transport system permease protein